VPFVERRSIVTNAGGGGWWFRLLNGLFADALAHRRARKLTTRDYLAARERVGKDEEVRRRAAQVGLATLKPYLDAERERRKSIEEKARANLAAITIALTIVVAGPTSLVAQIGKRGELASIQLPVVVLLAIAALYFLWSGHMALRALLLREWWQLVPEEELWDEAKRAEHTWWYVLMNQKVTIEKTNALDVSYTGMKCGMVTLVLLLVALATLVGAREAGSRLHERERQSAGPVIQTEARFKREGDGSMRLFPGSTWTDLATAAVACVSVAGVWWTFWPGHRERLRERREQRLQRLLGLHVQFQEMGEWASTSYDVSVHNPEWYNAAWYVNPIPWGYVENFNRLVIARDYRKDLTEALVTLERATRHFHDMLAEQAAFRGGAPTDIALRWPAAKAAAAAKGAELAMHELTALPAFTDEQSRWLAELYRRNKAIHVEGIGNTGSVGLHAAWSDATARLHEARASLQAGRDSRWRWVGHVLAVIFALLGLLFLADFGWSLFTQHRSTRAARVTGGFQSTADSPSTPLPGTNSRDSTRALKR
jgi:hypothetical protein